MRETWKKLLFKATMGVLLFVLANLAVYRSTGFFQRERDYHETVRALVDRPDVAVILMGDSHVAGIPEELLDAGAHNLAAGGEGYREIYAKLRYVLAGQNQVQTLLLTADYHMFGAGRVQSSNRSFVDGYLLATRSQVGYEKNWLSTLFNLAPLFNDDFVQYLKKDARQLLRRTQQRAHEPTPWQDIPDGVREERARETGRGDHAGVGAVKEPIYWFERVLGLARQHGIDVVLVRYPASAGYLSQIPAGGKEVIDRALARMGAPAVIDLSRALREPAYFSDEDHVNRRGAAALLCLLEDRTDMRLSAGEECSTLAASGNAEGRSL